MFVSPGKIFGTFFAIAALLVALTIVARFQVSMRMQRVNGTLADEPNGGKAISYSIGHLGSSRANSVNVKVRYCYTVNGKDYEGATLGLNGNSYGTNSEEKVKQIITELTRSSEISVWYDPKHPEFSVILEPYISKECFWLVSLVLFSLLSFRYLDSTVVKLQSKNRAIC